MSNIYLINGGAGLTAIDPTSLLPVGMIVSYGDQKNPRKDYLVISEQFRAGAYGQDAICEDGHTITVTRQSCEGPGGWEMSDTILDADEMKAWIAKAEQRKHELAAEHERQKAAAAERRATLTAQYLADYPYLDRPEKTNMTRHALVASNLRKELARAFPGVVFSVKSKRFSGGDSADVSWSLGPMTAEVEKVAGKYQLGHFDGMDDSYERDRENIWVEVFGGVQYVSCSRWDEPAHRVVALALCADHKLTPPDESDRHWRWPHVPGWGDDIGVLARQIILQQAYPVGAVITGIEKTNVCAGLTHEFYRCTFTVPEAAPVAVVAASGDIVRQNEAKDGVELHFPAKPAPEVIAACKAHGFRWTRFGSCWYKRRSPASLEAANKIAAMVA